MKNQKFTSPIACSLATLIATSASTAYAQSTDEKTEIIVTAKYPRGAVATDVPPVEQLDAEDIASYGVSSVQDLLSALSSSTTSSRGRGSGRPIVLINGQRTSGFREVRDLPPEAIQTVQIFPEELALQYGYRPDQRVINFILKEDYTGFALEGEYREPTQGGRGHTEAETTLTRIGKNSRFNINLEYENNTAITEAERDIIQDAAGDAVNLGTFRTLAAPSDKAELNINYSRTFDSGTSLSLNAGYVFDQSRRLLGLPSATLNVPATSPFAQSAQDESVFRYFNQFGPLRRTQVTNTAQVSAGLNGSIANWRWSLTTNYEREQVNTDTDRSGNVTALQDGVNAGTVDPFAADVGTLLTAPRTDEARIINQTIDSLATMSGTLLTLPSGQMTATVRGGYNKLQLDSSDIRNGMTTNSNLSRDNLNAAFNIDIPLADENIDVAEAIGKLSINGNIGYSELSDFGGLLEFRFGLNWEPFEDIAITASAIGEEAAPGIQQLGNPTIVTPNVNIFDFARGESILASITTGGNLNLPTEKRRDIKLAINYRPKWLDGMRFLGEYFRNNSKNVASSFPILTPEIEAAFPGRVVRDTSGQLIAIDQRPVNYSNVRSERIRYGFNFSKRFGQRRGRAGRERPGTRDQRPARPTNRSTKMVSASPQNKAQSEAVPQQSARPAGRGGTSAGRRRGGRWRISAYHTIRLDDRVLIRPGVQELDLLNGSAVGSSGGSPRHEFEIGSGWFNNGLGFRLQGKHQSATRVNGGLTGSDLRFSDLTTLNLRLFINLNNRGNLTENIKFLKNSRIAITVDNIFNDIQDVRDNNGLVPLRYQPGFLDPVGRYLEISLRKRF
jgi:iron complex outermembrane recepter protein